LLSLPTTCAGNIKIELYHTVDTEAMKQMRIDGYLEDYMAAGAMAEGKQPLSLPAFPMNVMLIVR
jgi:hypothetical protein